MDTNHWNKRLIRIKMPQQSEESTMAHWKGIYRSEQSPLAPSFSVCLPGKTKFTFTVHVCSILTSELSAFVYFVQHCSCQNGSLWLRTSCAVGSLCKMLQPWKAAGSVGFQVLVLDDPSWKASVWIVFIWCWSTSGPISVRWKKGVELQPGLLVTENRCVNVTEGLDSHLHFFRGPF